MTRLRSQAPVLAIAASLLSTFACGGTPSGDSTHGGSESTGGEDPVAAGGELAVDDELSATTEGASDDVTPSCGASEGAGDVRFEFVAPEDGFFMFRVEAEYDSVLALLDADGEEIACNDDEETKRVSQIVTELRAGERYALMVDGYADSVGAFRVTASEADAVVPEGRQGLLALDTQVDGTTTGGADHFRPSCGSPRDGSNDHVWHFVAPEEGAYRFDVTARYDSVLAVIDSDGNQVGCNDDTAGSTSRSQLIVSLEAGRSYGIVIDGYGGATGDYELIATNTGAATTPPNQPGGGTLTLGQPVTGDISRAADSHTPTCGATTGTPDHAWELTTTQAATYRVHVDSQYDAVLAILDENGQEVACNDDAGSTSAAEVMIGLASNRTYRVVVDGYNGAVGGYQLVAELATPTAPALPAAPAQLTAGATLQLGRAVSDDTRGSPDQLTPSCGSQAGSPDDVYELTVPRRATYRAQVSAQFDSVLAIYDDSGNEIACNDDHRSTSESLLRVRLDPRTTYYVVVDGYNGAQGAYVLTTARERKPGRRPRP